MAGRVMGHPVKRTRKKTAASPFMFVTRRLKGIKPDSADERADKDRKIEEFLKRRKQPQIQEAK